MARLYQDIPMQDIRMLHVLFGQLFANKAFRTNYEQTSKNNFITLTLYCEHYLAPQLDTKKIGLVKVDRQIVSRRYSRIYYTSSPDWPVSRKARAANEPFRPNYELTMDRKVSMMAANGWPRAAKAQ